MPFGPSNHPFTNQWIFHWGTDIAEKIGAPVLAVRDGTVVELDYEPLGRGNYVILEHEGGIFSCYAQLSHTEKLDYGQVVSQGQKIGKVGATGLATGPHLHFELRKGTLGEFEILNPLDYLPIPSGVALPSEGEGVLAWPVTNQSRPEMIQTDPEGWLTITVENQEMVIAPSTLKPQSVRASGGEDTIPILTYTMGPYVVEYSGFKNFTLESKDNTIAVGEALFPEANGKNLLDGKVHFRVLKNGKPMDLSKMFQSKKT